MCVCVYIWDAFNKFPDFFVQAFKIVVDSWKFTMLLLYILWDDWPIFMISASNEQLQQQLEYTLLKPDYHSWWISKMLSGHEDTLEEWYAIKLRFKLGKSATETYGMLHIAFGASCMNRASVFQWHKRFNKFIELSKSKRISKMQSGHEDTLEERYAIKFFFKLGKNATETHGMLHTAFGASCMNRASVFQWHKRFKEGRESVRDDDRCGRNKEVKIPELIGQIKNFMDKDCRVSIETICAQFDINVGTIHTIICEEVKMWKIVQSLSQGCSKKIRKKDVVMTAGRWSSWSIQILQFLMLWWPVTKAGSTAMTQTPRERVPSGSMLALPDPRRPDRANPPTNFWWSLFLTALAGSTCTGFPLDRQSTWNTILRS